MVPKRHRGAAYTELEFKKMMAPQKNYGTGTK